MHTLEFRTFSHTVGQHSNLGSSLTNNARQHASMPRRLARSLLSQLYLGLELAAVYTLR
jgi:hypothetical protein